VTQGEFHLAITRGKNKKSPGVDGIPLEIYVTFWHHIIDDITLLIQDMYGKGAILDYQKQGLLVSIQKHAHALTLKDYRPITILNTDFKILTILLANRLWPWMEDLHQDQHCGLTGTNVYDALATIRDVVAFAEHTRTSLCIVSIDFHNAFDNVAHDYLDAALAARGFGAKMRRRISGLYERATSKASVNGFLTPPFPIRSSIRQGCPLSSLRFALCLNPLIHTLNSIYKV
jgi:hypothetical protein